MRNVVFGIFIAICVPFFVKLNDKNTCSTYYDYFLINFGGNCYYNSDVDLDTPDIIKKYAGNVQTYIFTTEDGYELTMFRIFKKNSVGVILLQPPISAGAIAWLSDGAESLAFILWNKGYDVWLSNHRGASFSRKHINLTEADSQFWDFSFHEIALYDLDAQFNLIREKTNNSQITYIGYSMSSTIGLTYASLKPESSQKFVKSYILVAPVVFMKNFSSIFKYIFYIMSPFERVLRMGEFPTFEVIRWIGSFLNAGPLITDLSASAVMGWTSEMDPKLFPFIFRHHGRGITNKMIYHYSQIFFNQSHFKMYDYGKYQNEVVYGTESSPLYPLENIKTPIYIITGDSDRLANSLDIDILNNSIQIHESVEIKNHNHIDYFFSKHRWEKTYTTICKILNKYMQ